MKDLRIEKGKKTKENILLASLEILFKEGRNGFSIRKLAQRAGVSSGNIYHHFKNMDEILEEAFKYDLKISSTLMKSFEFNDLESLIENFVVNIITIFKQKKENCQTSHDPFLELVSTNKNFLAILKNMESDMKTWFMGELKKFLKKELPKEKEKYLTDIMSLYIEGARTNIFFIKKDTESYINTWRILSKHLVHTITEEV